MDVEFSGETPRSPEIELTHYAPAPALDGSSEQTQPLTQEFNPDPLEENSETTLESAPQNPVHSYGIHPRSYSESLEPPSNVDPNIELVYEPSCPNCVQVGGGYCIQCAIVI